MTSTSNHCLTPQVSGLSQPPRCFCGPQVVTRPINVFVCAQVSAALTCSVRPGQRGCVGGRASRCSTWTKPSTQEARRCLHALLPLPFISMDQVLKSLFLPPPPFFLLQACAFCRQLGATLRCRQTDCGRSYHFPCAVAAGAQLNWTQRDVVCPRHSHPGERTHTICIKVENRTGDTVVNFALLPHVRKDWV